jgi:hypothetical protein
MNDTYLVHHRDQLNQREQASMEIKSPT